MNKFKVLIIPIALFIWICTTLMFVNFSFDAFRMFQQKHLNLATNYAVDAAVEDLVDSTTDLDMDHADFEAVAVDPGVALDTFCVVFLKNLGMNLTEGNIAQVKSTYIDAFCVATYDGYYIAEPTKFNSGGGYDSIFGIKQPYLYKEGNASYAFNLGGKTAKKLQGSTISVVDAPIPKSAQRAIINTCVSDDLMSVIMRQKDYRVGETIFLPADLTNIERTNPIENVTVFAYVSDVNATMAKEIDAFGIGGARVTHERFVACYRKNGQKYYTYTSNITDDMVIDEIVENPRLAAEKGYMFDFDFFDK